MSPHYTPNSSNVSANIPVFDKDSYEFVIKSIKPRNQRKEVDGKQVVTPAMTVNVECISRGPMQGKKLPLFFGLGDTQWQFWKRFMIAAYDYPTGSDGEERFNDELLPTKDESFAVDDSGNVTHLGSYYKDVVEKHLFGDAEVTYYKKDPMAAGEGVRQNQWSWRGLSSSIPSPETVGA